MFKEHFGIFIFLRPSEFDSSHGLVKAETNGHETNSTFYLRRIDMKTRKVTFENLGQRNLMTGDLVGFGFGGWGDPDFTDPWVGVTIDNNHYGSDDIAVTIDNNHFGTDAAFTDGGWGDPGF